MNSVNKGNNKVWLRAAFYASWLILGLLQCRFTELLADEAYYWKYAQHLSWGYFDHPPVVAVLIRAGYTLLHNELGVRLMFVLMSAGFVYLLEDLVRPKRLALFYLSVASVGVFQLIGLFALPDMPLLFFTAAYLWVYRRYLESDNIGNTVLLACQIALMLLSKYHGVLVIAFTILANPALFKRRSFWLTAIMSVALFMPHIRWQLSHDMPSVSYHLSERSTEPYQVDFTLNYLLSVLLIFAPITGLVFAWHTIKSKTSGVFDSTLKYMLIGILMFFFMMTFKGRAEANWVAFALVPAFILGYRHCEERNWFARYTKISFLISMILIGIARLYMVWDFLPDDEQYTLLKIKIHHTKAWAETLQDKAGKRPLVFMNKYQYAAQYEYYTGNPAISLNNRMGRKNQYNIWNDEQALQGKDVMLIPNYDIPGMDSVSTEKGMFQYCYIDNFRSASALQVATESKWIEVSAEDVFDVPVQLNNRNRINWNYEANPLYPAVLHAIFFKKGKFVSDNSLEFYIKNNMPGNDSTYTLKIKAPGEPGAYELYIDASVGWLPAAINSKKIAVIVP